MKVSRETSAKHRDELLKAATRLFRERGFDKVGIAESHAVLGKVADRLGDSQTADSEFESAIKILEQLGLRERLLQCHGAYAEILERRGELQRAYSHMKKAVAASRPQSILTGEGDDAEERVGSA